MAISPFRLPLVPCNWHPNWFTHYQNVFTCLVTDEQTDRQTEERTDRLRTLSPPGGGIELINILASYLQSRKLVRF